MDGVVWEGSHFPLWVQWLGKPSLASVAARSRVNMREGVSWLPRYPWFGCRGSLIPERLLSETQYCVHEAALHPGPYHLHQEYNRLGVSGLFLVLGVVGKGALAREWFCMEQLWIQLVLEAPAAPDPARLPTQLILEAWRGSALCLVQWFLAPGTLQTMTEVHPTRRVRVASNLVREQ